MEKNTQWLVVLLTILGLVAGFTLGGLLLGGTEVKEVPGPTQYVNQTVEVPVDVEVFVEKDFDAYKQEAIDLCFAEFVKDKNLDKYEEAYITKVSDEWQVVFDEDTTEITVNALTYKIRDTLEKDTVYSDTHKCVVIYEDGEDNIVNWEA